MVPFFDLKRQYEKIKDELLSATKRVYEGGYFVLGDEVSAFEEEFARYCGVKYGVGVGSGTDALTLALKAAGIGEGDHVVTAAHSFIASALAISFAGATPLFVDVDPETYTLDPNALEDLLKRRRSNKGNRKVKAVLPVHLYGHPADMEGIRYVASRYDLRIIEDACQAHGAMFRGKKVGSLGDLACFSFYPTKNLGGYGDGGMIVTNERKWVDTLRLLRHYGQEKKYRHLLKGGNSRLDEVQAAILRVKLNYLDQWNETRREKAKIYTETLKETGILCPVEKESARHVYHLYVVRVKGRDSLQSFLKGKGIDTLIHYPIPIHLQKAYREMKYHRGDFPITERCAGEVLSLPFFPEISKEEMEEVRTQIQNHYGGNRSCRR